MITTDKRPNPNQERDADIARKLVANCERLHVPHELTAEQLAGREPVTATDIMWVCVEGNVDAGEVVQGSCLSAPRRANTAPTASAVGAVTPSAYRKSLLLSA